MKHVLQILICTFLAPSLAYSQSSVMNIEDFNRIVSFNLKSAFCNESPDYYYLTFNKSGNETCEDRASTAFVQCSTAPSTAPNLNIKWKATNISSEQEANAMLSIYADCMIFYHDFYKNEEYKTTKPSLPVERFVQFANSSIPHLLKIIQ